MPLPAELIGRRRPTPRPAPATSSRRRWSPPVPGAPAASATVQPASTPAVVVTRTEYLEINGVALSTPAYWLRSLVPLKSGPATRGNNRLIPGTRGRKAYRPYTDQTRVLLPMVIVGDHDNTGATLANPSDGLQDNIDYLLTSVVLTADAGGSGVYADGTRLAIWHLPDGVSTRSAYVQVLGLDLAPLGRHSVSGVLDFVIPAGRFS